VVCVIKDQMARFGELFHEQHQGLPILTRAKTGQVEAARVYADRVYADRTFNKK